MRARILPPLFVSLVLVLLGATGAAAVEVPLGWTWDQVELQTSEAGETLVKVEGSLLRPGAPGEPALPARIVRVEAPDGHTVASFSLDGAVTSDRSIEAPLAPITEDRPSEAGGPVRVEPLAEAYGAPMFPAERARFVGITLRRGVAYANFAVFPLVVREGRILELLEHGILSVQFAPDPNVPLPLKSLRPHGSRSGALPEGDLPEGSGPGFARTLAGPGSQITQRPSEASAPVDYVVLTIQAFESAITPFVDWKNQTGTATTVRTLEWLYDAYPDGVDSQERIRRFLTEAYRYWGTQWVLIVGGPGEVPIRKAKSYAWLAPTGVDIITDLYYACLDGNWNRDGDAIFGEPKRANSPPNPIGDGVDFEAEMYVGRVPATSAAQVTTWVNKYFTYARTPDLGGYLEKTLFLGEALFATDWTRALLPTCGRAGENCEVGCSACVTRDGADDCLSVIEIMDGGPIVRQHVELYEYYEYWQTHGRPNAELEIKASVVQEMNNGAGIIHHVGHGDKDRLSIGTNGGTDGNGRFLVSDARAMANGDRVSFVYAINCNSAAIDFDCLGEVMVFAQNGGAVEYIGSSNLDFPNAALLYQNEFYSKVFQDLIPTTGQAYYESVGELMAIQQQDESDSYLRFVAYSLLMMGDPQMGIWLKTPSPTVVSAPTTFTLGGSSLAVDVTRNGSALAGATVCAYKANDVYAVGTTDIAGHVVLAFQPTSTGNFQVTVLHPDAVPYTEPANRVVSAPPAAPAVSLIGLPVVDDQGAQTSGNDNGRFEEGETIGLGVNLSNGGGAPANNVTLTLTLSPPEIAQYLEIIDETEAGITVPANTQLYQVAGAFYLRRTNALAAANLYQNGDRLPLQATVGLSGGVTGSFTLPLPVYRPLLTLERSGIVEMSGNGNGIPENGETILWSPLFRNLGAGTASPFRVLATALGGATIEDGDASLDPGNEGDLIGVDQPLRFTVQNALELAVELRVESTLDPFFVPFDQPVEFVWPTAPIFPTETPPRATPDAIVLQWVASSAPDLHGHVLERSLSENTGFAPIHEELLTEMNYFRDEGLPGLTRFYYRAAAVDSSGNRSVYSNVTSATTSPATLPGWPFSVRAEMNFGCPTIENINAVAPGEPYEIFLTADNIYGMKADGTEIIDGDGISSTPGIWSPLGGGFWSKPAIADLDGDGDVEIVATSRYESGTSGVGRIFVWDRSGALIWQKQVGTSNALIASPVIANIDGDAQAEVIAHNRGALYAWNHDGTPVIQANANGRLAFLGGNEAAPPFTYGSPAAADLDGDNNDEIILVLETNYGDTAANKPSHVAVVDGDGTILEDIALEVPANGDEQPCNSSPSLADVDDDGILEIFCSTRSRLWAFNYLSGSQTLVPAVNWPQSGYVSMQKHPTNWVEPTPAIGDIDGDGDYDVVLGAGLGQVIAVDGRTGALLPGFPRTLGDQSKKIGSAILVNLDGDAAAEILIGNNDGTLYGLNADGTDCPGFPYLMGGRLQHGITCWDIDRDNHPNLVIQSEQLPEVTVLDISNVFFPNELSEAMAAFPWCSFRHDARNTGTMSKAVITPALPLTVTAVGQKGEAVLTWDVAAEPASFEIQRQDLSGSWVSLASEPPTFFQATEGGYRYVDRAAPGTYLYRVLGYYADGKPMYESVETAVTILPFALRLVSVAPNPFNPRTAIRYETPGGALRVEVLDLGGRRVRTLARGEVEAGSHELVWDGRDDEGHDVGSGVYMLRMSARGGDFSRKIVLLR